MEACNEIAIIFHEKKKIRVLLLIALHKHEQLELQRWNESEVSPVVSQPSRCCSCLSVSKIEKPLPCACSPKRGETINTETQFFWALHTWRHWVTGSLLKRQVNLHEVSAVSQKPKCCVLFQRIYGISVCGVPVCWDGRQKRRGGSPPPCGCLLPNVWP